MKALFGACESSASHLGAVASLSPAGTSLENLQPSISTPPPPLGQGRALGWPTTRLELPLHSFIHSVHSFKYSWTPSVYWPLPLSQNSV